MKDIDGSIYTLHSKWNPSINKCYVEIKKDGEHYCYSPLSIWTQAQKQLIKEGYCD